nr:uncharacterized protein LOC109184816 [Ipomoea batatas]
MGGQTKSFSDIDSDEWCFMTLKEKFVWVLPIVEGYEDECIEEGYVGEIGEFEDELLSVDEEFTGSEYEEYNDDDYDFEQYIDSDVEHGDDVQAEVHAELNMSDETPLLGSDGEVERNVWDSVKPPVEQNPPAPPTLWLGKTCKDKVKFKEAMQRYAVANGKKLKFIKNDKIRCRRNMEPINAQREEQEEILINTQLEIETESQI